jgi:hypothetical protein
LPKHPGWGIAPKSPHALLALLHPGTRSF